MRKKASVFLGAKADHLALSEVELYILDLGSAIGVGNERNRIADKLQEL